MNRDAEPMSKIVEGLSTKSAKIRALANAGYARAEIARFLDIRYQHVRNVLVQAQEASAQFRHQSDDPDRQWIQVAPDGRVVFPVEFRRRLGVENGGEVQLSWDGNGLRVRSYKTVIREIQEIVAQHNKDGRSLVDELIAERRAEAEKE